MRSQPPEQRWIIAVGSAALALSLIILRSRNLYEDEWVSLSIVSRPLAEMWRWCLTVDIHPPGIYALDRLLLRALGAPRAVGAVHLALWSAGAMTLVSAAYRLLSSLWGRIAFAIAALMHPHVLMWNSSIRWYPVWWGLALAVLAWGLLPRRRDDVPGWAMTLGLGAAIGALAHLDYLAVPFAPSFAAAWLVRHGSAPRSLGRLLLLAATAILVASPMLGPVLAMIRGHGGAGDVASLRISAQRMLYVLSLGDALLPWNPVSVLVALALLAPSAWLLLRRMPARWGEMRRTDSVGTRELAALAVFTALMLAAGVMTGVGSHGYAFLGLTPLVVLLLTLGAERSDRRAWRALASATAIVWISTGAYDMIARTGTAKRQLNDHPEEIVSELGRLTNGEPAVVVTDDLPMTFEINERRVRQTTRLVTCSWVTDDYHGYGAGLDGTILDYRWVIVLEHVEGEWDEFGPLLRAATDRARQLTPEGRMVELAPDPDFRWKNLLRGARMQAHRLRAWYGHPVPGDWEAVDSLMVAAGARSILRSGR
ncbi:MAG: hypothetical protein ACHQ52_07405 [Candidatus Eisenbacteria bacterium]